MTTATDAAAPVSAPGIRRTADVANLAAIYEPLVNVVTLERVPCPALVEDSGRAAVERGFRRLFSVSADRARRVVPEELRGFLHLGEDVAYWVEALADLTGALRVGVRLARLETAMCPRFHVDRVTLRLVCTYQGRGTELAPNEYVDRTRLGLASRRQCGPDQVLLPGGRARSARPFDVVLLKGEAWPGNAGFGAVHRSPAASGDSPRLVLTLDLLEMGEH